MLVGTDASTVGKWRRRFAEHRLAGLYDEPRSGAPRKIGEEKIAQIMARTLEETPPDSTHWSLRSMARAPGYAPSTIHRIWQAFGLQPHRSETFKLSSDPLFVEFEAGKGGGVTDLVRREQRCDTTGALQWLQHHGFLDERTPPSRVRSPAPTPEPSPDRHEADHTR